MSKDITIYINTLKSNVTSDDFIDSCYEFVEQVEGKTGSFETVKPILRLFEEYENVDFGNPGPLVHFVEKFYRNGYEEELLKSLKRKPTIHTLWLLNRIINGVSDEEKSALISFLDDLISNTEMHNDVKDEAIRLKSLHS